MSVPTDKRGLMRYAILGLPLGCIGLPLYVHLPKYYSDTLPLSLGTIGYVMFAARFVDCFADPWIGKVLYNNRQRRMQFLFMAAAGLGLGVIGLFYLPTLGIESPLLLLSVLLALTYISYSFVTISYYSDGLAMASGYEQSTRLSAYREASIIIGVMLASILPVVLAGRYTETAAYRLFAIIFVVLLAVCVALYRNEQAVYNTAHMPSSPWRRLLANTRLRWVFLLYFFNATATSITSTLFLFFTADILKTPDMSGAFLGVYFMGAIAAMPLWLLLSNRMGKRASLLLSMSMAVISFGWALALGEADVVQFFVICLVSGAAMGGDLAVLPSLLSDALDEGERDGALEFGIWNFLSKLNLAMAAGIALPLVGSVTPADYPRVLHLSYAAVPCMFKLLAITILFISPIERSSRP